MMAEISHVDLTTVPPDIWHELSSYLDTGDFVSLAAVNQSLRRTLTSNTQLLSFLLRHRMNIEWPSSSKRTPYEEIVFHIPNRRCSGCGGLERIPSWDAFLKRKLCADCRDGPRFRMIVSTKAKSEYKLDENDLSPLKATILANPHYRGGPPMRLYSVVDVMKASKAKMAAKGTTLEEERRKTQARREALKRGRLAAMEKRRIALIDALAAVGLELDDHCRSISRFIEQTGRPKLTLEQTVQHAVHGHDFECQIPTEDDEWY